MKIKNPASRVFYFQSIRAVDIGTMDNTKMRSNALLIYCSIAQYFYEARFRVFYFQSNGAGDNGTLDRGDNAV